MSTPEARRLLALLLLVAQTPALCASPPPSGPNLGQPLTAEQRAALDGRSIYPDGRGLPPGQGSTAEGKLIYEQKCRACHGANGRGGSGGELISGEPLDPKEPDRAIDNYWPYATTLFDFTRRAMPMNQPGSLSNDEVYALCAYLLDLGGIIDADQRMNAKTLPLVRMPNRDGFVWIDATKP